MRSPLLTLASSLLVGCAPGGEHLRCDAGDSARSETGLRQLSLEVSTPAAKRGEPIALEGGGDIICALRKDEKRACAGEFGWAMHPVAEADTVDESGYTDVPRTLGLPFSKIYVKGNVGHGIAPNGQLVSWFVHAVDKSPKPIPWIGPAEGFALGGPGACAIGRDSLRCSMLTECGMTPAEAMESPRKQLEFAFPIPITSVAVGEKSCVSLEDGTVHCWGEHFTGGTPQCQYEKPVPVEGLDRVVAVASGPERSVCALRDDSTVHCWGRNASDQFGVPEAEKPFSEAPVRVPSLDGTVQLEGGSGGIAALKADGSLYFWGHPIVSWRTGKLGPQRAQLPRPAVDILVGSHGVCSILTDRSIYCAGGRFDRIREKDGPSARTPFEGLEPWVNAKAYRVVADFSALGEPK